MRNNNLAHALLLAWGEWHIRRAITEPGWAPTSSIARLMAGMTSGAGVPGHRILAADMTPDQARTQRAVMDLPEPQRRAIEATYCGPKSPGHRLAAAIGMTHGEFRTNLSRGRAAVERLERERLARKKK